MSPSDRQSIVATRLRVLRAQRPEITQVILAERLGRSQNAVHKWEQGASEPRAADIVGICEVFHVSADWFLGITDSQTGLAPGQWLVDVDAVASPEAGRPWAIEIPRRHRIVDHTEKERIRADVAKRIGHDR
jgi:transcriptional regulator with XRE-family HTH domain